MAVKIIFLKLFLHNSYMVVVCLVDSAKKWSMYEL